MEIWRQVKPWGQLGLVEDLEALLDESLENWGADLRARGGNVETYVIYIGFDRIEDPDRRHRMQQIPTSFRLSDEQIDDLKKTGRQRLESSPPYQALVKSLQ